MKTTPYTLLSFLLFFQLGIAQTQYPNLASNPYLEDYVPKNVLQFVNDKLPHARIVAERYEVPVDFLLCVAGLETGWGSSELSQQANNFFGIKNPYNEGPSYCLWHEDYVPGVGMVGDTTCFKSYNDITNSFADYVEHLMTRGCYLSRLDDNPSSFDHWASLVFECGYATDPDYKYKLETIRTKYYFKKIIPSQT